MIGYEFELLVREGDRPLSKPTFEKFHSELARRGWKNKYDAGTLGLTGSQKGDWIVTTDDGICIMEINTPPRDKTKCTNECLEKQCCNKSYIKYFNAQRFPKSHHALMIFAGHHVWLDVEHHDLIKADVTLNTIINAIDHNEEDTFLNCFSKVFIEYRNIGAQPQPDISAGPAFLLGMQEKIPEIKQLLDEKPYTFWKQFCDLTLKDGFNAMSEGIHAVELCSKLLTLAQEGLRERGYGEEQYLAPLWQRLKKRENPAQELIKIWKSGELSKIWGNRDFK